MYSPVESRTCREYDSTRIHLDAVNGLLPHRDIRRRGITPLRGLTLIAAWMFATVAPAWGNGDLQPMELRDLVVTPRAADYAISPDGSVRLAICYNWSCASVRRLELTAKELAEIRRYMDQCDGDPIGDRLQRLRIGIWGMEVLVMRHIPELANDRPVNDQDADRNGRMDCVDNATNTNTFLSILSELKTIPGWTTAAPQARDLFTKDVHWTAIAVDERDGARWAVDTWFRPQGHLPFVSPLSDWMAARKPWEPPLDRLNPYPTRIEQLCPRHPETGVTDTDATPAGVSRRCEPPGCVRAGPAGAARRAPKESVSTPLDRVPI